MAKLRVTFEVDTIEMFDRLAAVKGHGSLLGDRLIGVLMTGEAGFSERVGLSYYGIEVADVSQSATAGQSSRIEQ